MRIVRRGLRPKMDRGGCYRSGIGYAASWLSARNATNLFQWHLPSREGFAASTVPTKCPKEAMPDARKTLTWQKESRLPLARSAGRRTNVASGGRSAKGKRLLGRCGPSASCAGKSSRNGHLRIDSIAPGNVQHLSIARRSAGRSQASGRVAR